MPNRTVLTPLRDELERAKALTQDVELICATGSHRPATEANLASNALIGDSLATSSQIVAAVFTLLAGSPAIVKQVAATMETHASGVEEAAPIEAVSIGGVLSKLISG